MSFGIPVRNGLGLGLLASTSLATGNVGFTLPVPTLNLNFTTMTALPSTITFSRPSNATYYDSTGKLTYAPNNLLLNSATLSTQTVTTAQVNYILSFQGTGSIVRTGTSTGTLTGTGVSNRVSVAFTPTAGTLTLTVAGSVTSAQLEAVTYQTTPSTYNATTSAAYYGARLDYNPATLAARGLLIEEARTNSFTQSNPNNAYWTPFGNTKTSTATGPDGASGSACLITNNGTSTTPVLYSSITFSNTTPATESIFVKKNVGNGYILNAFQNNNIYCSAIFDLNGTSDGEASQTSVGSSGGTIVSTRKEYVGNGWFRLSLVGNFASAGSQTRHHGVLDNSSGYTFQAVDGLVLLTSTASAYVFGVQLETGSFATSYIPTAGGAVARSADTASMTGTNFSSWYNQPAGAFLVQFDTPASGTRIISAADDNTANNNVQMLTNGTDPTFLVTTSGAAQASIDAGTVAANTVYKFAGTYSANDFAACISGGTVGTDTSGTIPTVDRLRIGAGQAGNTLCGHVALLNYYPQRLPNATLQSLTS
jgi:hypothetical protein